MPISSSSHVTYEEISRLRVYHVRFDPYYLWHRSYAHQFAFPFADAVTLSSPGVGVVGGPGDHRRSSGIASRASRNVLTTTLFYRFAKRHVVTFDRPYVYRAARCIMRVYGCVCMLIRHGRVGLASNIFGHVSVVLLSTALLPFCPRFLICK